MPPFTTNIQIYRSSAAGAKPAPGTRLAGEPWVNLADKQIGFIDATQTAQDLLPVRYFSTLAAYSVGDLCVYSGALYQANGAITPGPFNSAQWSFMISVAGGTMTGALILAADPVTALGAATKQYADTKLEIAGGTMTGNLTLAGNPAANLVAAPKQYVDAAVASLATVAYVDAQILSAALGIGDIKITALSVVPTGWLQCDGASYATATYSLLFAAIGYTYGGAGANFNVPNAQNKVIVGAGGLYAAGATGGAATVTLDGTTMPSHTHGVTQTAHSHTDPGHSHTDAGHSHGGVPQPGYTAAPTVGVDNAVTGTVNTSSAAANIQANTTGIQSANANIAVNSVGGGQPHENMQPYLAMNVLIRAA